MLDAIKGLFGGRPHQKQSDALQGLIVAAGEQREALAAMLEQIAARRPDLTQITQSFEQVDRKVAESSAMLEGLAARIDGLDVRTTALAAAKHLVQTLVDTTARVELKEAASQDTLLRIEALIQETNQRLDLAMRMRDELTRDAARFERDGRALVDTMRETLETLALERKQFEAFDHRLHALQSAVEGAEARLDDQASQERHLAELHRQAGALGQELQSLHSQADELTQKQAGLEGLQARLTLVDDLARQTSLRYDSLRQSRADLDVLRRDIHEIHKSHLESVQLRDRLAADRAALEAFGDRMTAFRAQTPQVEAEIDGVLAKLSQVESATRQAVGLERMAVQLDAQLARVTGHVQIVETLDTRISRLHVLSADVDRKLADQLARRAEIDGLRAVLDGLVSEVGDTQRKVRAVEALEQRVLPLDDQLRELGERLDLATVQFDEVRREEAAAIERRSQFEVLVEQSRGLAADVSEGMRHAQALADGLERSVAAKDDLLEELSKVEKRQRDALAQSESAEDHVRRLEVMFTALEQRRAQLAFSERRLATVEARLAELSEMSLEIDHKMKTLADREAVVMAVKAEVDAMHQISAKSRADLDYVSEQRTEVATLRLRVEALLASAADAQDAITAIEAQKKTIDAVHERANLVASTLEDIRSNMEALGEQKAAIDHLALKLARLEFMTQEAQSAVRALQHERELAERVAATMADSRSRSTAASA